MIRSCGVRRGWLWFCCCSTCAAWCEGTKMPLRALGFASMTAIDRWWCCWGCYARPWGWYHICMRKTDECAWVLNVISGTSLPPGCGSGDMGYGIGRRFAMGLVTKRRDETRRGENMVEVLSFDSERTGMSQRPSEESKGVEAKRWRGRGRCAWVWVPDPTFKPHLSLMLPIRMWRISRDNLSTANTSSLSGTVPSVTPNPTLEKGFRNCSGPVSTESTTVEWIQLVVFALDYLLK